MKAGDLIEYWGRRKRFHGTVGVLVRRKDNVAGGWIVNFPAMSNGNFYLRRAKFDLL
tara:strand:- start:199 stop:369 length:171 start_codon:yes stop_codon:yes gene_type:complete